MAIHTTIKKDIVGLNSLSFIKSQVLVVKLSGCNYNTRLYPYFDGHRIGDLVTGTGDWAAAPYAPSSALETAYITTDGDGKWEGTITIPTMRFNTGERIIKFQKESDFWGASTIPGVVSGSASATFTANGLQATYQTTIDNVLEVFTTIDTTPQIPEPRDDPGVDPLAQSFFTYGVQGGCFITSIDIYFREYDPYNDITLEIREMINGQPSKNLVCTHAISTISGSEFANPSAALKTLTESQGHPFVDGVSNYHYPCITGDSSLPTTFTFLKPVYLSENRDYCFVLLSASNAYIVYTSEMGQKAFERAADAPAINEQPFIGSLFKSENNVTWTANQTEDVKFTIRQAKFKNLSATLDYNLYAPAFVILGTQLSTTQNSKVVKVTTTIKHNMVVGSLFEIIGEPNGVYNGVNCNHLTNYTTIQGPTAVTSVIDDYTFTFTYSAENVAASDGPITTNADPTSDGHKAFFNLKLPRKYQAIRTGISAFTPPGTTLKQTYNGGDSTDINKSLETNELYYTGKSASVYVPGCVPANSSTAKIQFSMYSNNSNVSPVIDLSTDMSALLFDSIIAPRDENTISGATWATGTYTFTTLNSHKFNLGQTVYLSGAGTSSAWSGVYTIKTVPNVHTMTCVLTSDATGAAGGIVDLSTNKLSVLESELLPIGGNSKCRYISKIMKLETMSVGVRAYVNAVSTPNTWFDMYIRTSASASSTKHTDNYWTKLTCDVDRTQSTNNTDFKDYSFYVDDLVKFDAYDIKIVLYSKVAHEWPIIANYRSIILAS